MRGAIDSNHDGAIDDGESQAFGTKLAGEIAAALEVTIDRARQRIAWSQVVVGMGSPQTTAGAASRRSTSSARSSACSPTVVPP